MAGSLEQSGTISRGATFLLILVSLLCISLIGGTGYVKFQVDRTTYRLTSTSDLSEKAAADEVSTDKAARQTDLLRKRQLAESDLRNWTLALTFLAWVSLIFTAAMIMAVYLVLQRRHSPALRALGQSIANLARGDMQTPIWGIERHDSIGDLARSVDLARYHFSQMPDVSLMSDQGPVRLKFEGGARTLFDAMMHQISTHATRITEEAKDLTSAATSQHKILTELPLRLNNALEHLQRLDTGYAQTLQVAGQSLTSAAGQMEKLVPFMQSRAQNMAEVTQIAGTQVASTIKNMMEAEQGLRMTANKSTQSVEELSHSTKELGERIFAALNLLQASGKVLNETTESSQSRLKELVETLGQGEEKLSTIVDRVEQRLEATAKAETSLLTMTERSETSSARMDEVIGAMVDHQEKLNEQINTATTRLDEIIGSFTGAQQAMGTALEGIKTNGDLLSGVFNDLKNNNEQVLGKLTRTSETSHEVVQHLASCSEKLMEQLQEHLANQSASAKDQISSMAAQSEQMATQAQSAAEALSRSVETMEGSEQKLQTVQERFSTMINDLGGTLERQASDTFSRTEDFSRQNLDKLSELTGSVDQALQRLTVLGQLTNTLGTVAGQLGQLIPTLGGGTVPVLTTIDTPKIDVEAIASHLSDELASHFEALITQVKPSAPTPVVFDASQIDMSSLSEKMFAEFEEKWKNSVNQIDSVRDDLSELMEHQKSQLEMRLVILDRQMKTIAQQKDDPAQISMLQEIVDALGVMNAHLAQTDLGQNLHEQPLDQTSFVGESMSS